MMNATQPHADGDETPNSDERASMLFASLVMSQTNMALLLLGRVSPPEGGAPPIDLDAAKTFIDHLEMLEQKTRGNLTADESRLLAQSLMTLRMGFVDTVEQQTAAPSAARTSPGTGAPGPSPETVQASSNPPLDSEAESKKKFTKKY